MIHAGLYEFTRHLMLCACSITSQIVSCFPFLSDTYLHTKLLDMGNIEFELSMSRVLFDDNNFLAHISPDVCPFQVVEFGVAVFFVVGCCNLKRLLLGVYVPCIYRMPGGVIVGDSGLYCCGPAFIV